MSIKKDIQRYKNQLVARVDRIGLYENFGQKEIRQLKENYPQEGKEIERFDKWCMNYC